MRRRWFFAAALPVLTAPALVAAAEPAKRHRIAFQVDQSDAALMNLVLNNVSNVLDYYRGKHEDVQIEVVAFGPGLNMLRDDKSPVKARIKQIKELSFPSNLKFAACNNTKQNMEKQEGHEITLIPQAQLVPAGVIELSELQEQGWSYIRT